MSSVTPGVDGVSGGISENMQRASVVGKRGYWEDRGSPRKSSKRSSPSGVKQSKLCGRPNPYILRTNINDKMFEVPTSHQSAATVSIGESLKSTEVDPVAIPMSSNVVVAEVKLKPVGQVEFQKIRKTLYFSSKTKSKTSSINVVASHKGNPEFLGSLIWNSKEVAQLPRYPKI